MATYYHSCKIFSVSTMASLLSLCVSTHCCRNTEKKENPYGEIGTLEKSATNRAAYTVVSRNRTSIQLPHHNLGHHQSSASCHSASLPQSSKVMKRALPKLPHSEQLESENPGAIYSTIDHSTPMANRNGSLLYSEGPANPTYECIDVDTLYSKMENGGPSTRRYDYPIFTSENRPPTAADDMLYQSTSQIYAGVSEDAYSSITSQGGGEANYDTGYSHIREGTNAKPTCSNVAPNDTQQETTNIDQLYTQIQRGPPIGSRATNPYPAQPLTCSEFAVDYTSNGSDRTSREPSYRYITVRESVDAIRQRLSEIDNNTATLTQAPITSGGGPIREHYYSSIGGGSDYETVSATTPYRSCDSRLPEASASEKLVITPNTHNTNTIAPPKPPTSPIPVRIGSPAKVTSFQPASPLPLGENSVSDDCHCSSTSEKIRKLRTNFFGQELELLKSSEQLFPSNNVHFEKTPGAVNRRFLEQESGERTLDSAKSSIKEVSSSQLNDDNVYQLLITSDSATNRDAHEAQDAVPVAFITANTISSGQKQCHKKIAKESRSLSFHEQIIYGTKQCSLKDLITVKEDNNSLNRMKTGAWRAWSSTRFLRRINEKERCFPGRCVRLNKQTENNFNDGSVLEDPIKLLKNFGVDSSHRNSGFNLSKTSSLCPEISRSMTSLQSIPNNVGSVIEIKSFPYSAGTIGSQLSESHGSVRSVQIASLTLSHESLDSDVQIDEGNHSGAEIAGFGCLDR